MTGIAGLGCRWAAGCEGVGVGGGAAPVSDMMDVCVEVGMGNQQWHMLRAGKNDVDIGDFTSDIQ